MRSIGILKTSPLGVKNVMMYSMRFGQLTLTTIRKDIK
jgi:hypothetical protein